MPSATSSAPIGPSSRSWARIPRSVLRALGVILVLASLALVACGGDDDESTAVAGAERYCELSEELDAAGRQQFAELERDPGATEADFQAAEREFFETHASEIEELERSAPDEVAKEVGVVIDGLRARSQGDEPPAGLDEAEARIDEYENQSC